LAQYPDLASARDRGLLISPLEHFVHFGYSEGRSPSPSIPTHRGACSGGG
jgi:hypothetical protein